MVVPGAGGQDSEVIGVLTAADIAAAAAGASVSMFAGTGAGESVAYVAAGEEPISRS